MVVFKMTQLLPCCVTLVTVFMAMPFTAGAQTWGAGVCIHEVSEDPGKHQIPAYLFEPPAPRVPRQVVPPSLGGCRAEPDFWQALTEDDCLNCCLEYVDDIEVTACGYIPMPSRECFVYTAEVTGLRPPNSEQCFVFVDPPPSISPTSSPTSTPTSSPTIPPTISPTSSPVTPSPTTSPITSFPTRSPTFKPTASPVSQTKQYFTIGFDFAEFEILRRRATNTKEDHLRARRTHDEDSDPIVEQIETELVDWTDVDPLAFAVVDVCFDRICDPVVGLEGVCLDGLCESDPSTADGLTQSSLREAAIQSTQPPTVAPASRRRVQRQVAAPSPSPTATHNNRPVVHVIVRLGLTVNPEHVVDEISAASDNISLIYQADDGPIETGVASVGTFDLDVAATFAPSQSPSVYVVPPTDIPTGKKGKAKKAKKSKAKKDQTKKAKKGKNKGGLKKKEKSTKKGKNTNKKAKSAKSESNSAVDASRSGSTTNSPSSNTDVIVIATVGTVVIGLAIAGFVYANQRVKATNGRVNEADEGDIIISEISKSDIGDGAEAAK
eukprot:m.87203 g.87203  ORF g.87203 m.87203 type:complete len:551 (-) comp26045_c0_seq1:289-1941(-)